MTNNLYDYLIFKSESICNNRTKIIHYESQKGLYELHIFREPKPNGIIGSVFFQKDKQSELKRSNENRLTGLFNKNGKIIGDKRDLLKQQRINLTFNKLDNQDIEIISGEVKPIKNQVNYAI